MAYGDDVMKAIRGTVLDGRPRIGGVGDAEASARARRAAALSAAADYARSGRGGQGDSDMHLERAAEEALSQAAFAGIMTYGRSALALGRRTLADQLARRRASPAAVLRRTRYQGGAFGEGVETLSDTALNPSTLTGARPTGRLGEVATVSEEYSRAYPGIERDVVVNVVPDREWAGYVEAAKRARAEWAKTSDTSRGFFDRRLSAVSLRAQMPGETMEAYFDRADKTLVHELQHYAQMRDGLPATSPGSGYEWYRTAAREVDARNSANRLVLTPQERAEIPRSMTQDVKPEDVHTDDKGGKSGGFRGWKAYRDAKEAAEAEAAAVAVVNAGITNAPPLSVADLADSRASAEWLKTHERRGLVAEGTLPHTGRPRFYSGNGFMEGDASFQGDRFSSVVPVDPDAYHEDAEAYKKTGQWAVIPTVYPDADGVTRLHTSDAAESEYRKSGSHFGIFEGMENAESGAQWDHHMGNAEWAERETRQAAKGGDNFGTFRNFLATDDVPETIFGIPVVQDESQYTEKDLEFFRKNPKAAGFYDLGDEEVDEDVPPVMDLFGGDAGAYQEAFAQKRKDLVNDTAERQYKALLKFKDPDHRRRAEAYLYAALDSDARNAALLDEYNRQAEANRPSSRRGRASYDEMIERGRGRFAGGAWEKALGELVSPDWVPPAEAPAAQPRQGGSFMSRAKEALEVAKELPGLIAGGAERQVADVKETIGAAGAVLVAPKVPRVEVYDPMSRTIRDGKTGRIKRTATDRDRAGIHEVNKAIGVRQALSAGNTRGAYPGSLNNPGNVEKRKDRRQGEVDSPHERWAKFATPQDGLREMADAIRQIAAVKLAEKGQDFTIRNFAEVYAPRVNKKGEKENDTDKYIRDLSADTGFDADEELARWDEGDMARFLRSVVKFESGAPHSAWFTDEEYAEAAKKLQEGAVD